MLFVGAASESRDAPPDPSRWEEDVKAFEAADRKRPPSPGGILFVGSSSIRLWTTLQRDFPRLPVINRGVGGSQIPEITALAHRIVIPYRPRLIVFYCGSNDLANGRPPDQVVADFQGFVARVHGELPDTRIAFVSIAGNPARKALIPQFADVNRAIAAIAAADPRVDYIDVDSRMLAPGGALRPEIFVEDQLHMNPKGYRIWREVIGEYLMRGPAAD